MRDNRIDASSEPITFNNRDRWQSGSSRFPLNTPKIRTHNQTRRADAFHRRKRDVETVQAREESRTPRPPRRRSTVTGTDLQLWHEAHTRDNATTQLTRQPLGVDTLQLRHELLLDEIESNRAA